nr:MAG TPA: hypothetical protein [Caudoviricetes sp.]
MIDKRQAEWTSKGQAKSHFVSQNPLFIRKNNKRTGKDKQVLTSYIILHCKKIFQCIKKK